MRSDQEWDELIASLKERIVTTKRKIKKQELLEDGFVDDPDAQNADKHGRVNRIETEVFARTTIANLVPSGKYDSKKARYLDKQSQKKN